jgi:hypothetical protein
MRCVIAIAILISAGYVNPTRGQVCATKWANIAMATAPPNHEINHWCIAEYLLV